jgi:hypothetical protein
MGVRLRSARRLVNVKCFAYLASVLSASRSLGRRSWWSLARSSASTSSLAYGRTFVPFGPQISRWLDWFYRLLQTPRNQDKMPGTGALFLSVTDPIGVHAVAAREMSDHEKIDALMMRTAALQGDAACITTSAAPRSAPIPS